MAALGGQRRGQGKVLGGDPVEVLQLRPAAGEGAGLVEHQGIDPGQTLQGVCGLYQDAAFDEAADGGHLDGGDSKAEGAGAYTAPRKLKPGIYGLSYAFLDTPWPKVARGKALLKRLTEQAAATDHDSLLELVSDAQLADPEAPGMRGLNSEMEQLLSAQFICTQTYGTRSSTTVWLDRAGSASWRELSFDAAGVENNRHQEDFQLR